ncbi:hypothetical protein HMPREF9374_2761, partial [Desmospora sp. 8437]
RKGKKTACGCPKNTGGKIKTVDDLVQNAKPGKQTKGKTTQYELSGGFDQATKDYYSLNPKTVKDTSDLKVGILKDGRKVIVRTKSTDSRPTLEIQDGKKKVKFRYSE